MDHYKASKIQLANLHDIYEVICEQIKRLGKFDQDMHTIQNKKNGMQTKNQVQVTKEIQILTNIIILLGATSCIFAIKI
jgi:hypothetical protein